MPRVAVFLSVYNASEHLQQSVESVLDQSFEDWSLMVLDDGSQDPEVGVILDRVTDPRVTVMRFAPSVEERHASVRYATNFNYGVSVTTSDYVTFLCGDDFYYPQRLERMVHALDGGAHVVYGPQILLDQDGQQRGHRGATVVLDDAFHRVDLNSVMLRRDVFEEVGGFPTEPAVWKDSDAYLWRKVTHAGYRFTPVQGAPTDCKRYRPNSVTDNVLAGLDPWHHEPAAGSSAWAAWVPAT